MSENVNDALMSKNLSHKEAADFKMQTIAYYVGQNHYPFSLE